MWVRLYKTRIKYSTAKAYLLSWYDRRGEHQKAWVPRWAIEFNRGLICLQDWADRKGFRYNPIVPEPIDLSQVNFEVLDELRDDINAVSANGV